MSSSIWVCTLLSSANLTTWCKTYEIVGRSLFLTAVHVGILRSTTNIPIKRLAKENTTDDGNDNFFAERLQKMSFIRDTSVEVWDRYIKSVDMPNRTVDIM